MLETPEDPSIRVAALTYEIILSEEIFFPGAAGRRPGAAGRRPEANGFERRPTDNQPLAPETVAAGKGPGRGRHTVLTAW